MLRRAPRHQRLQQAAVQLQQLLTATGSSCSDRGPSRCSSLRNVDATSCVASAKPVPLLNSH